MKIQNIQQELRAQFQQLPNFQHHKIALSKRNRQVKTRDIRIDYRVLQTIQMKLILLCVWAEWAVLGSAKTALKLKYKI